MGQPAGTPERNVRRRRPVWPALTGLVVGAVLGGAGYSLMLWTSTTAYCVKCHEIRPAYQTWKTSSHRVNSRGVVAECSDCHLPPSEDIVGYFLAKGKHTVVEGLSHALGRPYERDVMRRKATASIPDAACQKCHSDLLYPPMSRGAMLAHRSMLYARKGYEKRCLDCHENLVHKPSALYASE